MSYLEIHNNENKNGYDDLVSLIAMLAMFQFVVFILFQIIVAIIGSVVLLFMEYNGYTKETIGITSNYLLAVLEIILITILVFQARNRYNTIKQENSEENSNPYEEYEKAPPPPIVESTIIKYADVGAILGICWGLFLGIKLPAIPIMLIIVNSFTFIFVLIFIITRLCITKRVKPSALINFLLTTISLYFLIRNFT